MLSAPGLVQFVSFVCIPSVYMVDICANLCRSRNVREYGADQLATPFADVSASKPKMQLVCKCLSAKKLKALSLKQTQLHVMNIAALWHRFAISLSTKSLFRITIR